MNYPPFFRPFWTLLVIGLLAAYRPSWAQSKPYYSIADSTKGYWKLQTDYTTRSTHIQFLNAHHQVIYEEKLAGRYVKLTRHNVDLFDALLDGLTNNRLLDTQVKSYELLASNRVLWSLPSRTPEPDYAELSPSWVDAHSFVMLKPMVTSTGRLRIHFANPQKKRVFISLADAPEGTTYYTEWSRLPGYNRYINLRELAPGRYNLQIRQPQQTSQYELMITRSGSQYGYHLRPSN